MRYRSILAALALASTLPASAETAAPVELRILAINDFHGNLRPSPGGIRINDPEDKARKVMVAAGGAEYMATLVRQLRDGHRNTIFVAAGDLIGASPFLSAMFHDEPSIESLSKMGLAISSIGNHEFDEGKAELLRMQNGGCHPVDGCQGPHPFTGAKFHYLAASTIETATGNSVLPPYEIREFDGVPVGFIGLTLKGTAGIVSPAGIAGLEFRDEAETVNALVPQLKGRGVEAIVVLIHEGGEPTGDYNECPGISGPIVDIVKKFDRAVDIVVSGHTHRAYVCDIDGRLVTSGDKYGTLVTAIDVKLDPASRDIVSARAENVIVANASLAKDPDQTALIEAYDKLSAPIANRPAGSVTQTLSRIPNEAGESALGDVIADAQLLATRDAKEGGAVIALTNPGGIRTDIVPKENGAITFGDVFASQPFRNRLVTMTLTGRQLKDLLEQQWSDPKRPRILQVSNGFSYAWDAAKPFGERVIADRMSLGGRPIEAGSGYRVTLNDYLAVGGDGFTVAKQGTAPQYGGYDADALFAFFRAHGPIGPLPPTRILRVN
ncbi:bifunctional metallophosphatase/5'-nucleotidase [Bradyrhizobium sp. 180]|uniref:bifunctional metallophosphatase/5'-nucleotidase n=1 Tax=unclassified Bradyrhizobium TaxID=2631580 RepID=UPI001FF79E4A|nr:MULTISPECIES: bifunctional metallophosphatase/5'-nucleotidase [unclassified Bradyrhizobium]MCK1422793.1 bifunctional metallophosphatase/5'-nucleotidase [Bradyrhizobium sp. CW12]MCK1493243.1 bifunctional metallophosphatase/5'-nucleotidase [Bradyrhizobium sp. 180]MCK1527402.1 bifunctional metallophosphatase/5'-nucleotidase [Bradyrhizobium sp. 182]MCK1598982.1 bifunctional metallophosphatase/5'-nucleotidase [Bradyrhizobium sp. 164]MCK1648306.1 bifunctional metallophosphatase/5'-nucleotidase [B